MRGVSMPFAEDIQTKEIWQEIKSRFENAANPGDAVHMAAYMRNQFLFYGIKAAARRNCYKDILKQEKKKKSVNRMLLDLCWKDPHREFQYFVTDYLHAMQAFLTFEDIPCLEHFLRSKQWWDTVDALDTAIGNIGYPDQRVDDLMLRWSEDLDFWVRRAAIDHQRGRKEYTNTDLLKSILVNNLGSSEFFINKAIGWALRDYSKTDPEWVRDFLGQYENRMAPLSIREASKYI